MSLDEDLDDIVLEAMQQIERAKRNELLGEDDLDDEGDITVQ